jgi:SAM-dependent methyltransferase
MQASCPACEGRPSKFAVLFTVRSFGRTCPVLKCAHCGLVFKGELPDEKTLTGLYSKEYVHFRNPQAPPTAADVQSLADKLEACRSASRALREKNKYRILDVGCGGGSVVRILRDFGHDAFGIDPYLPEEISLPYLHRDAAEIAGQEEFDIVLMLNVAEHLPRPEALFSSIRPLLACDGVLLLTCPFGDSLARRAYCGRWGQMALDEHLLFWTRSSLQAFLRRLHFEGRLTCRILGTPFPLGKVPLRSDRAVTSGPAHAQCAAPVIVAPAQGKGPALVWRIARQIQGNPKFASLARSVLASSRLGDYMQAVFWQSSKP